MQRLILSILLLTVIGVFIFIVADAMLPEDFDDSAYEKGIPLAVASFSFLTLPYLHQLLRGRRRRFSFTELPATVAHFDEYLLRGSVIFLYGVLFLFAVSGLSISLVWLVGETAGLYITRLIAALDILFLAIAVFLVGSWVGTRVRKHTFLTTVAVVAAYSLLWVLSLSLVRGSFRPIPFIMMTGLFLLLALVGARVGARRRMATYLRYLLSFVPPKEQLTVADNVYQEVSARVSSGTPISDTESGEQPEANKPEQQRLTSPRPLSHPP